MPLDQLIRAARAVEAEEYELGTLAEVCARGDELGRLARVFEDMVGKLATRYESLVNFMRSVVIKVRGDRVITFANAYASELLGFANAELVGQHAEPDHPAGVARARCGGASTRSRARTCRSTRSTRT